MAAAMPTDPTAYHRDFWLYASYYGEAAARQYYQQWSPPEGTRPPPAMGMPMGAAPAVAPVAVAPMASSDPAWDKYASEYREWYNTHGRLIGADPNPPRRS
jgi:hypothetical protein